MWKYNISSRQPEKVSAEGNEASTSTEELPSCFDTTDFGKFLEVSKDKLTVRYTGNAVHDNDVGSIQGNQKVPRRQLVYYYEMKVWNAGERGLIAIGFAEKGFKMGRHPGWELNSYGYHADDGRKLTGVVTPSRNSGEEYGPTYATDDVVGAGIFLERQEMFFTKNGKNLGVAFRNVLKVPLYPTIGLHSRNEHVEVNFGQRPFEFDLEGLIQEQRQQQEAAVQSVEAPSGVSHQIVREYLLHYGYARTLRSFVDSAGLSSSSSSTSSTRRRCPAEETLDLRRALREAFMTGNLQEVSNILENSPFWGLHDPSDVHLPSEGGYPTLEVHFFIKCLAFIELLRNTKIDKAVEFARKELSPLRGLLSPSYDLMLADIVALLAYIDPKASPLRALLDKGQREAVADMVNHAVLEAAGQYNLQSRQQAVLERLLAQLVAVQEELHAANGGHGQVFQLSDHLLSRLARPQNIANGSSPNGHSADAANGASNGLAYME